MIKSVELVSILKDKGVKNDSDILDLWPPKKKAKKITPDFNIESYFFQIVTTREYDDLKIFVNKFEVITFILVSNDNSDYIYKTRRIKASRFLGFNLGLFELQCEYESSIYPLTTLNNKQSALSNNELNFMYESVAGSEFFNLYISKFCSANALAKEAEIDGENKHFWLKIAIAREIIREMQKFVTGELEFTSKINKRSEISCQSNNISHIEEKDIEWIIENPDGTRLSSDGPLLFNGFRYEVDRFSQSSMFFDFDTYENRLLQTCLYSMKFELIELCEEYKDSRLFPHSSLDELISKIDHTLMYTNSKLQLLPPFNTYPEHSNKYLDDVRYSYLFELITRWYSLNSLVFGNEIRSPIMGITTIFEHYCFTMITECLIKKKFVINELDIKNTDEASSVTLINNNEEIIIYYEPVIGLRSVEPLKTSKLVSHYTPDIVIVYKHFEKIKCGVIDSKFAELSQIKKVLGPEIYYKYGLFLHKPDNTPLDYVFAMYPDTKVSSEITNARNNNSSDFIVPSLGSISIPFNTESIDKMADSIINLITN